MSIRYMLYEVTEWATDVRDQHLSNLLARGEVPAEGTAMMSAVVDALEDCAAMREALRQIARVYPTVSGAAGYVSRKTLSELKIEPIHMGE